MRIFKVIAAVIGALVLSVVLLEVAKKNARGESELITQTNNGFTFEMATVPRALDNSKARLDLKITGPLKESMQPVIRYVGLSARDPLMPNEVPLVLADSSKGSWFTEFATGARGDIVRYQFEILDAKNNKVASFTMPGGAPFETKNRGEVPLLVLVGHLGFMFGTVFFVALAAVFGVGALFGTVTIRIPLFFMFLAGLFTLLGGYPFGFAMNWYAFGTIWEGVPFGTDLTDNKTQILLLYFLLVIFSGLGTITKGRFGRDVLAPRTLAALSMLSFFIMLGIYLIPHSAQFGPTVTNAICYSITALFVLIYVVGYLRTRRT